MFLRSVRFYSRKNTHNVITLEEYLNVSKADDLMKIEMRKLSEDLERISVGRANPSTIFTNTGILDKIMMKEGKTQAPIQSVAQISVRDSQNLILTIKPGELPRVQKAIQASDLGLNPLVESPNTLRVPVPRYNLTHQEQQQKKEKNYASR